MKHLPKFVRQKMAQPVGGDHPETNLLAAFAEGGLTGREREQMLLHLGECAACRQTLAVAMPEIAAEHPHAAAAPSGTQWLLWPMLRWAGVGAAVVVVAAAVVIQSSRRSAEMPKISLAAPAAKSEQAKEPPKSAEVNEVAPVLADRVPRKEAATGRDARVKVQLRKDTKKDAAAGKVVVAPPPPAPPVLEANKLATSNAPAQLQAATESHGLAKSARVRQPGFKLPGGGISGAVAGEEKQQQPPAPLTPIPSANETVEVAVQPGVEQMQKAKSLDRGQSDLDAVKASRPRSAANARAVTGGVSGSVSGAASQMSSDSASVPTMKAALVIAPRWRLSSEGALERSTDRGRSWQFVPVAATPTILRSFSSLDRDIWAGGTSVPNSGFQGGSGALYHSGDNGQTWTRVIVKAGDVALESEIVRVEFTDAQHGSLRTVSGQTWTTSDAGLTWSVRR
jgi:hypothetical protein